MTTDEARQAAARRVEAHGGDVTRALDSLAVPGLGAEELKAWVVPHLIGQFLELLEPAVVEAVPDYSERQELVARLAGRAYGAAATMAIVAAEAVDASHRGDGSKAIPSGG